MSNLTFFRWANTGNNKTKTQTGYGTNNGYQWVKVTRIVGKPGSIRTTDVKITKVPETIREQAEQVTFI